MYCNVYSKWVRSGMCCVGDSACVSVHGLNMNNGLCFVVHGEGRWEKETEETGENA